MLSLFEGSEFVLRKLAWRQSMSDRFSGVLLKDLVGFITKPLNGFRLQL